MKSGTEKATLTLNISTRDGKSMGSFGITELLIVLIIIVLLFGTTKLKSLGSDLGSAIKGFRRAVSNNEEDDQPQRQQGGEPAKNRDSAEKTKQP